MNKGKHKNVEGRKQSQ